MKDQKTEEQKTEEQKPYLKHKKPNISPGKWEYRKNMAGCYEIGTGWGCGAHPMIASCNSAYFTEGQRRANARAISAVPDLLNEAYATYLMLIAHPQYVVEKDQEFIDRVDGLEKSLIKAGYEYDKIGVES